MTVSVATMVSTDELLMLLGVKEAELFWLRRRVAELEQEAAEHGPATESD